MLEQLKKSQTELYQVKRLRVADDQQWQDDNREWSEENQHLADHHSLLEKRMSEEVAAQQNEAHLRMHYQNETRLQNFKTVCPLLGN